MALSDFNKPNLALPHTFKARLPLSYTLPTHTHDITHAVTHVMKASPYTVTVRYQCKTHHYHDQQQQ